jgi:hypothetical protein
MPRLSRVTQVYPALPMIQLTPLHSVIRMAFVVPNVHYPQVIGANFVENVIRKTLQICPAKTAFSEMKSKGIYRSLVTVDRTSSLNSSAKPVEKIRSNISALQSNPV